MNKKGFTLIELLAVIIILGILMIIAIPSVTRYISNSRKEAYVDTARGVIGGARNIVNSGDLGMYDTNVTYYIPTSCIKTESGLKSPYGEFTKAYIGVVYDGLGYNYYWISVDDAGQGVPKLTPLEKLDSDDVVSDLNDDDIENVVATTGIGSRRDIKILNCNTKNWDREYHLSNTSNNLSDDGEHLISELIPSNIVCIPAVELISVTCNISTQTGCNAAGIGYGNTITYGTLVNGTPKRGNAYDCKVKQNGGYTERFYYIGTEGENTKLIYYKNMNDQATYQYDSNNKNLYGPRTGYNYLPSTSEWNNPRLIAPGTRQIVNQNGATTTGAGTTESFTYTGKAARFLTFQELKTACGKTALSSTGSLDSCNWLLEGLGQYDGPSGSFGYWLENPASFSTINVYAVGGENRDTFTNMPNTTSFYGVRPVITIRTADLG